MGDEPTLPYPTLFYPILHCPNLTARGSDLSEQMVKVARKKMLYQELHVMPIAQYFSEERGAATFDVVVAADVLAYVGELRPTFQQVGACALLHCLCVSV